MKSFSYGLCFHSITRLTCCSFRVVVFHRKLKDIMLIRALKSQICSNINSDWSKLQNLSRSAIYRPGNQPSREHSWPVLTCACIGIHPWRVEPTNWVDHVTAGGIPGLTGLCELTRDFCPILSPSCVVAHVFSWPPARLRHLRGGVGRSRSLISSSSGRPAAWPN